jgi:hypothetical protein
MTPPSNALLPASSMWKQLVEYVCLVNRTDGFGKKCRHFLDWSGSVPLYGDGPECSTRQEPKVLVSVKLCPGGTKLSVGCCSK